MPWSRRPVTNAATPWAPSWVMVTSMRVYGQTARGRTSAAARAAASATTTGAGGGCTAVARRQTSAISSTTQASRILAWNPGIGPRNGPQCARRSRPIGCPAIARAECSLRPRRLIGSLVAVEVIADWRLSFSSGCVASDPFHGVHVEVFVDAVDLVIFEVEDKAALDLVGPARRRDRERAEVDFAGERAALMYSMQA